MLEPSDYKKLFELSPASILVLDQNLRIVAVTEQYLSDTMRTRAEILHRQIFEIFDDNPEDPSADGVSNLNRSLNMVIEKKCAQAMPLQRYDIQNPSGEYTERYWTPLNLPIFDDEHEVKFIIHKVDDVTEYVKLRQDLSKQKPEKKDLDDLNRVLEAEIARRHRNTERLNQQLGRVNEELVVRNTELKRSNDELANFAATASHDIQAPFRVVGTYMSLIEEECFSETKNAKVVSYFEKISQARDRIKNLLADLLQFAMVSGGSEKFEKVEMAEVLKDVLSNLEANIRDKKAKIEIQGKLPVVDGEPSQLIQLFQNLIGNAIKFNTGLPDVKVLVSKIPGYHLIEVKDNGVGIEPQYFKKVFEVFQRLNSQNAFPGTGLGLSICKRVVDHHGGKIWIESEPGKGTSFFFTLAA